MAFANTRFIDINTAVNDSSSNPFATNDVMRMLGEWPREAKDEREQIAKRLCTEAGHNPDQCVVAEIRHISDDYCATRCEKFLWEEYLPQADMEIAARQAQR